MRDFPEACWLASSLASTASNNKKTLLDKVEGKDYCPGLSPDIETCSGAFVWSYMHTRRNIQVHTLKS